MMDVVPKRHLTAGALCLLIIVSLVMIFSGSLDGAAAWANIIALPVAIIGVVLTTRSASNSAPSSGAQDRDVPSSPTKPAPTVNQIGFGGQRQVNVAGNYFERGHGDREGR
ncbi:MULTISPECIES: hypothetical protein [Micromonospora]|uniref:hypothetical protein n=1 Tax=Micromonospora TaxID=1873 RepID=UPI0011BE6ABD|nr:hypothetical protein [Micromonospora endolithica]